MGRNAVLSGGAGNGKMSHNFLFALSSNTQMQKSTIVLLETILITKNIWKPCLHFFFYNIFY